MPSDIEIEGGKILDLQSLAGSALVATFVAVALNRAIEWQKDGAAARAQLRGILLELAYAERCAERYFGELGQGIHVPVYRIATEFLRTSIGTLAASGALRADEAEQLHRFYIEADDETNKTLDSLAQRSAVPRAASPLGDPLSAALLLAADRRGRDQFKGLRVALPAARVAAEAALARVAWFEQHD